MLSCSTTDEITHDYQIDPTIGSHYTPPIQLYQNSGYERILLLPITGKMTELPKQAFASSFIQSLQDKTSVVVWPKGSIGGDSLAVSQKDVIYYAELLGATAILYIEAHYTSPTPPLHITSRLRLESLESGQIIASSEAYFDTTNKKVSLGARKYFKKYQLNNNPSFGSEQILSSGTQFAQYTGHTLGTSLMNKLFTKK